LGGSAGLAGAGAGGAGFGGDGGGGAIAAGGIGAAAGAPVGGAGGSGGSVDPGSGYYVSPTGSDDNPGTSNAPFRTIVKARDVVRTVNDDMSEDLHVYLRGGTYRLSEAIRFGPEDSAKNGHRIYYEAYPGETPVLSGSVEVSGWTEHTGGVYRAALDRQTKLRNLYVNDARAELGSKTVTSRGGQSP
jgi:hypothetical protein